jgi:hypothetical protein
MSVTKETLRSWHKKGVEEKQMFVFILFDVSTGTESPLYAASDSEAKKLLGEVNSVLFRIRGGLACHGDFAEIGGEKIEKHIDFYMARNTPQGIQIQHKETPQ